MPESNFAAHLLNVNAERSAKVAYIDDDRSTTYGELADRVRRFARALIDLGVRREERIFVAMLDSADLPAVFLGALYAGVVPALVNTLLPAADYAYMLAHSDARAVITSRSLRGTIDEAIAAAGVDVPVIDSLDALIANAAPSPRAASTHVDDIAFWLYSSGSTGKPKGTVHTHGNLHGTVDLYGRPILGIRESDVVLSAAKLFFAYGLGNALSFPLSVGATTVLMAERATPDAIFDRLTRHKPTIFNGVPTLYVAMLASPRLPSRDRVALRVCTSAGEALPAQTGEQFTAHFGCEILDGIGSTEMLHIFLSNRAGVVAYGTTGTPVPGYELELRDEAGAKVGDGEIGDLYVKGPTAALMYWRDREKSRATFQGAWVKTGDKYQRRADGMYVYAGRSDDMLKVSGQYVSPIEVEGVLQSHESVLEAAVIGKPDANGLIRTCAFVVVRQGHRGDEALEAALKAFVKTKLTPHKYPREIVFVAELPKTATGKIQRFKLREA